MYEPYLIIFTCLSIYIFVILNRNGLTYVRSQHNNRYYAVHNLPDKQEACNLISRVHEKMLKTTEYINRGVTNDNGAYIPPHMLKYVRELHPIFLNTIIHENDSLLPETHLTSYNESKGKKIVFCIRDVETLHRHDENIIMYVALHELSHIACPEIGHPPLFTEIFKWILQQAIHIGVWQRENYQIHPRPYCGITISENIL